MIPFKLNGKKLRVPSSWDDLTMRQFISISKGELDIYGILSLFLNIDKDTLEKATIIGLEDLIKALNFLKKPAELDTIATKIGPYKLPVNYKGQFNIKLESLGQFEDMRNDSKNVKTAADLSECYPKFCARYLQKIRDGVYDPQKAESMVDEILDLPAKEVISAGSFFYLKLMNSYSGISGTSQTTAPNQKKSKPDFKSSKRTSGYTPRYTTSQKKSGSRKM